MITHMTGYPFQRGEYYDPAGTDAAQTNSAATLSQTIGSEWDFDDINLLDTTTPGPGPKPKRSGFPVRCRLLKNNTGAAILPKRIVTVDPDAPGSALALAAVGDVGKNLVVADEYLPAAGVPSGAFFWGVVRGRTLTVTSAAVSATSITAGMFIAPATGGFANGTGQLEAAATDFTSTTLRIIHSLRMEARTAYTGGAAAADITTWVHDGY